MERTERIRITKRDIALAAIFMFIITVLFIGSAKQVSAKSKKSCYYRAVNSAGAFDPHLTKSRIKGNKLILKGSLLKSKKMFGKGKILKSKKRTFKISKKAKFYGSDPERGFYRISKKSYKSILQSMNGLEVVFRVKKGKVVWMGLLS